ncbi:SNF2 domain-containing protein CLASSY 3-like [Telopea speciosissima]|uniref:SNF2 domain-containing protein CLASSY 3-like n=1 Tax=Telopea speciosissima TaxID=54955 RepID=UPI001CC46424|nr:SNF2 domain-containing protein CLASSY 3-like [Telopea speciosissima]
MDPFYSIMKGTKSRGAFSKKSLSGGDGGSNSKKDHTKTPSRTAEVFPNYIAKRTRSHSVFINGTASIGENTRPLKGCNSSRKRKGLAGDGGNDWSSPGLGYGGRKSNRNNDEPVIVVLDGDDDDEECRGRGGAEERASDSDNLENSDLGRKEDSGLLGVKDDNVVQTNIHLEEEETEGDSDRKGAVAVAPYNCISRRTRSKIQVHKGDVEKFVFTDIDETQTSCDGSGKNDDAVDEDLGINKSHKEPSSSSTEEEDEENNADAKIASSKNDYSCQSSTDDSEMDDDSEDEDFGIDKSDGEPSSSSSVDEDKEGTSDSEIARERTVVGKGQERFVGSRMTKSGCQNGSNIDSVVPIVLDESQSSGDDIDDCSDENYGKNDSPIKETTSYREDVEEEKHISVVSQTKRRRYSGLDILIPSDIEEGTSHSVGWGNCVAQRTRSRTGSSSENKQKKLGTLSHPICFDVEEDNSYTENDEDENEDDGNCSIDENDRDGGIGEAVAHNGTDDNINSHDGAQIEDRGKKEEDVGKSTKRKRVRAPKDVDQIFRAMINSIWDKEEGEVLLENLTSKYNIPKQTEVETKLPLKFNFGIEKPVAKEKSDYDKELDRLWAEFDFALNSSEIGSFGSSLVDDGDTNIPDTETDPATLCSQGKHQLILDENIGIRCRICSFVKLELKFILPTWGRRPSERSHQQIFSDKGNAHMLDELDFRDDVGASHYSHIFAEGTVWDIIPGLRKRMYPHQCEGFEFMWKNLAGGIELEMLNKSRSSDGVGGCVISHAPGTGKTLLTIVFLMTYMKVYPDCRPVIIAPTSILLTWEEEFKKWKIDIPFHNLNKSEISGKEIPIVLGLAQRYGSVNQKRMLKLYSWSTQMSILGISYRLFGELVGQGSAKGGKKRQKILLDTLSKEIRKILLEKPGLLILDEGHTPRNNRTGIWKALSKIETERRIILSGTPFQNNFQELYNILCLVRPKFTDVIPSKGKWSSLTSSIGKNSDDGLQKLRGMLDPFVHVHRGTILKDNLPGLRNWTIYLRPTTLQKQLLDTIKRVPNTFELEHQLALVSVHPSLLMNIKDPLFGKNDLNRRLDLNDGVKTRFLMELIQLIKPTKERVLVFSQYIEPLKFLKKQLSYFGWVEGKEVLQMDGEDNSNQKQSSINRFNDPASDARILLASTKACSEGIHLIGASRVVLLDTVWNPSVEKQAISRAYRLGQKRFVYTYHLITFGTKEEDKYEKQVEKEKISKLVFSSRRMHGERINVSSRVPDDNILGEMVQNSKLKNIFEMIFQRE